MFNRVMIVDDSATARLIIQRCCQIAGLRDAIFILAKSGTEALELLADNTPDLILSDLNMPDLDGRELLRSLRKIPHLMNTPTLIISSAYSESLAIELMQSGASDVLPKPMTPVTLAKALANLSAV
jgi:two-component system chemotaxis response regulator CheY